MLGNQTKKYSQIYSGFDVKRKVVQTTLNGRHVLLD